MWGRENTKWSALPLGALHCCGFTVPWGKAVVRRQLQRSFGFVFGVCVCVLISGLEIVSGKHPEREKGKYEALGLKREVRRNDCLGGAWMTQSFEPLTWAQPRHGLWARFPHQAHCSSAEPASDPFSLSLCSSPTRSLSKTNKTFKKEEIIALRWVKGCHV